jgi:hypothetical protein
VNKNGPDINSAGSKIIVVPFNGVQFECDNGDQASCDEVAAGEDAGTGGGGNGGDSGVGGAGGGRAWVAQAASAVPTVARRRPLAV